MAVPGAACEVIPGDIGFMNELVDACAGRVAAMSLSPDTPDIIPVIERLVELGIRPFVSHTRADVAQTRAAIGAGARHATHFYDVFPPLPERDAGVRPAGVVEVFLADPETTVDFIADGCHVDPVVIQMAVRAKGFRGVALITDSNIGAGLPPGEYPTPWGYPVQVRPGDGARVADPRHERYGTLAGSALTMNAGIANLLRWLDLPPEEVWAMGTLNPARILGLNKGRLAPGADADLVLWNDDLSPAGTWAAGQRVFG
jgi:N-acetylglucosamine-6-phosphate deacetylase